MYSNMLPPCLYAQKLKHKFYCPFLAFIGILAAFSRAIEMAYISVLTTPMHLYTVHMLQQQIVHSSSPGQAY